MSSSVPSCYGLFRGVGVGGSGDIFAADDGSSREDVSGAVREMGNVGVVIS